MADEGGGGVVQRKLGHDDQTIDEKHTNNRGISENCPSISERPAQVRSDDDYRYKPLRLCFTKTSDLPISEIVSKRRRRLDGSKMETSGGQDAKSRDFTITFEGIVIGEKEMVCKFATEIWLAIANRPEKLSTVSVCKLLNALAQWGILELSLLVAFNARGTRFRSLITLMLRVLDALFEENELISGNKTCENGTKEGIEEQMVALREAHGRLLDTVTFCANYIPEAAIILEVIELYRNNYGMSASTEISGSGDDLKNLCVTNFADDDYLSWNTATVVRGSIEERHDAQGRYDHVGEAQADMRLRKLFSDHVDVGPTYAQIVASLRSRTQV